MLSLSAVASTVQAKTPTAGDRIRFVLDLSFHLPPVLDALQNEHSLWPIHTAVFI